jgi:hypothetical protein
VTSAGLNPQTQITIDLLGVANGSGDSGDSPNIAVTSVTATVTSTGLNPSTQITTDLLGVANGSGDLPNTAVTSVTANVTSTGLNPSSQITTDLLGVTNGSEDLLKVDVDGASGDKTVGAAIDIGTGIDSDNATETVAVEHEVPAIKEEAIKCGTRMLNTNSATNDSSSFPPTVESTLSKFQASLERDSSTNTGAMNSKALAKYSDATDGTNCSSADQVEAMLEQMLSLAQIGNIGGSSISHVRFYLGSMRLNKYLLELAPFDCIWCTNF